MQIQLFGPVPKPSAVVRARPARSVRPKTIVLKANFPDLYPLWCSVRQEYFPERPDLDTYELSWSKRRQKRTLASCNLLSRRVVVAREMFHEKCSPYMHALLYHEMCHAYLGKEVPRNGRRRAWHGKAFRDLERRHPGIKELDQWIKSGGWSSAVRSERARNRNIGKLESSCR